MELLILELKIKFDILERASRIAGACIPAEGGLLATDEDYTLLGEKKLKEIIKYVDCNLSALSSVYGDVESTDSLVLEYLSKKYKKPALVPVRNLQRSVDLAVV